MDACLLPLRKDVRTPSRAATRSPISTSQRVPTNKDLRNDSPENTRRSSRARDPWTHFGRTTGSRSRLSCVWFTKITLGGSGSPRSVTMITSHYTWPPPKQAQQFPLSPSYLAPGTLILRLCRCPATIQLRCSPRPFRPSETEYALRIRYQDCCNPRGSLSR
jgi:hypothetical protein